MDNISLTVQLIIALLLGAAIGIEREVNNKDEVGRVSKRLYASLGLRTFSLVSLLGATTAALYSTMPVVSGIITAGFLLITCIYYYVDTLKDDLSGITTEIALIFSFLIGVSLVSKIMPVELIIALTVVLILLLSRKEKIKDITTSIHHREINALVSYGIVALVILPFLPNESYTILDIPVLNNISESFNLSKKFASIELINPFKLWLIVALITGIDIIGYLLEKTMGKDKGWLLASLAGGFISSTATTQSIAQESKTSKSTNLLVAAAILSTVASFLSLSLILAPLNTSFFIKLLPSILAIMATGTIISIYLLKTGKSGKKQPLSKNKETVIFNLTPALKFAAIFLVIRFVSKIASSMFGDTGFLVTSALASVTGVDAVMINTAEQVGSTLSLNTAFTAFVLVNTVNLFSKIFYSFLQEIMSLHLNS
ncbi:MAG: MgtC/SapB family protein [bacterium]|nr:MgtC/SapB family protein [bacterium]